MNANPYLLEEFRFASLDKRLQWFNQPGQWHTGAEKLSIVTSAPSDFWQKTHYNFQEDSGHFLFTELKGDFSIETRVKSVFKHQYDQAGLMVRVSQDCWIKTSIENELDDYNQLGAVVTNLGYSDWSTQSIAKEVNDIYLRIERKGSDYILKWKSNEASQWEQLRMTHLFDQEIVMAGIYCCSPKNPGFEVNFDYLRIES